MPAIRIDIRQVGRSTGEATIRGHTALVDRPTAKGGDDNGPMGGEYFLTAVGGCFMSTLLAAIRAREADVSGACVSVTGTMAESPARFTAVELAVTADRADPDELAHLVRVAEQGCIMVQTLKGGVDFAVAVGAPA